MKTIIKISLLFIFSLLVGTICFASNIRPPQPGDKFPNITLRSYKGNNSVSSKNLQGKLTIYSFGSVTCPYCRRERPLLNEFYLKNRDNVNVVSIIIENDSSKIENYLKEIPVAFNTYQDRNASITKMFSTGGIPFSYVVDENGIILRRMSGVFPWNTVGLDYLKRKEQVYTGVK